MAEQIRGIILEGQSCSGKTSLFHALKKLHGAQPDAERNAIFLSEQYSQNLNRTKDGFRSLTRTENLQVLSDRVGMLEALGQYADSMGIHSRRARGLFFVLERFHLNFAYCFGSEADAAYTALEDRLRALHPLTVLCVISPEKVRERLAHRASFTGETATEADVRAYLENQDRFLAAAERSALPTVILNTDSMDWERLARQLLETIE